MASRRPSPNLKWSDLACRSKPPVPYPMELRSEVLPRLCEMFEGMRRAVNQPLRVLSAYRTPEHNRKVGGKSKSYHIKGMALDLACPANMSLSEFHSLVESHARLKESLIGGLGIYRWGIHIDCRQRRRRPNGKDHAFWQGDSLKSRG